MEHYSAPSALLGSEDTTVKIKANENGSISMCRELSRVLNGWNCQVHVEGEFVENGIPEKDRAKNGDPGIY